MPPRKKQTAAGRNKLAAITVSHNSVIEDYIPTPRRSVRGSPAYPSDSEVEEEEAYNHQFLPKSSRPRPQAAFTKDETLASSLASRLHPEEPAMSPPPPALPLRSSSPMIPVKVAATPDSEPTRKRRRGQSMTSFLSDAVDDLAELNSGLVAAMPSILSLPQPHVAEPDMQMADLIKDEVVRMRASLSGVYGDDPTSIIGSSSSSSSLQRCAESIADLNRQLKEWHQPPGDDRWRMSVAVASLPTLDAMWTRSQSSANEELRAKMLAWKYRGLELKENVEELIINSNRISAPEPRLDRMTRAVLDNVLEFVTTMQLLNAPLGTATGANRESVLTDAMDTMVNKCLAMTRQQCRDVPVPPVATVVRPIIDAPMPKPAQRQKRRATRAAVAVKDHQTSNQTAPAAEDNTRNSARGGKSQSEPLVVQQRRRKIATTRLTTDDEEPRLLLPLLDSDSEVQTAKRDTLTITPKRKQQSDEETTVASETTASSVTRATGRDSRVPPRVATPPASAPAPPAPAPAPVATAAATTTSTRKGPDPPTAAQASSQEKTESSVSESDSDSSSAAPHGSLGCDVCGKNNSYASLLICDNECGREFHTFCLQPPLFKIPEGDWYCPRCLAEENVVDPRNIFKCSAAHCERITAARYCSHHRCRDRECLNRQKAGGYCRRHQLRRRVLGHRRTTPPPSVEPSPKTRTTVTAQADSGTAKRA